MEDDDYIWKTMKTNPNVTIGGTAYNATSSSYTYSIAGHTTAGFNGTTGVISGTGATGTTAIWTASSPHAPYVMNQNGKINIMGADADINMNGKSLRTWMEAVEQRLAILQPNVELEAEWAELKELGDRYRELEQEIKDKMTTWDILKKP
jgi:hypothetical protein